MNLFHHRPLRARRAIGSPRSMRGVTLVELMVAMTLGLAIVAAVGYVYVSGSQGFRVQNAQTREQEDARFIVETLTRDIRMAGYFGCVAPTEYSNETNIEVVASQPVMTLDMAWAMKSGTDNSAINRFLDLQYILRGFSPATAATHAGLPSYVKTVAAGSNGGRLAGTDVLMILRSGDDAQQIIPNADDKNQVDFKVAGPVAGTATRSPPVLVASDCWGAKIFKASLATTSSGVNVSANNAMNRNVNASNQIDDLNMKFETGATLTNFEPVIYFIAKADATTAIPNPEPTLRRVGLGDSPTNQGGWDTNGGQTVASGVETFSLSYVVAPAVSGGASVERTTAQMEAGAAADWQRVTAVRVRFSMVSSDDNVRTKATTQTVGGSTVTDSKIRQNYEFTVGVRGRQYAGGIK